MRKHDGEPAPQTASDERRAGTPSRFTCPDCGGTLWESDANAMLSAQRDSLEGSLWTALRIIEERVDFVERMSRRARDRGDAGAADRYAREADGLEHDHGPLRKALGDAVNRRRTSAS